ncbi:MAG: type II secretion system protein [Sedimentisphaerales bacterium]|nr:type II secretion system protein [Sedimentisphaerales bacterium]MBN2842738.1 type II secretion system protein [Sedimentisphaerales bacterium]
MKKVKQKKHAFLLAEATVALGILGIMLGVLASLMSGSFRADKHIYALQKCILAALGQLDVIAATGKSLNADQVEQLWPGVTITIDIEPGTGAYAGLSCYKAVASIIEAGDEHSSSQMRYMPELPVESGGSYALN